MKKSVSVWHPSEKVGDVMTNSEKYLDANAYSIDYNIFELSDHLGRKNTLPALASFLV